MTVMLPIRSSTWSIVVGMTLILLLCDVSCVWLVTRPGSGARRAPPEETGSGRPALLALEHVGHHRRQPERGVDRGQEHRQRRDDRAQHLGQQHLVARQR